MGDKTCQYGRQDLPVWETGLAGTGDRTYRYGRQVLPVWETGLVGTGDSLWGCAGVGYLPPPIINYGVNATKDAFNTFSPISIVNYSPEVALNRD